MVYFEIKSDSVKKIKKHLAKSKIDAELLKEVIESNLALHQSLVKIAKSLNQFIKDIRAVANEPDPASQAITELGKKVDLLLEEIRMLKQSNLQAKSNLQSPFRGGGI